jgi:septum formation protein
MKVILASASPRRAELLKKVVEEFEVFATDADERTDESDPAKRAVLIAREKARAAYAVKGNGCLIVACDTIVFLCGRFYGKPRDKEDALRMLNDLNGKTHEVYSGVCIIADGREETFFDRSEVTFKENTEAALEKYIERYRPFDKAGSYGIQDGELVKGYEGSYDNIVGLPVEILKDKKHDH